jgi:hypothetical protein
MEPDNVEKHSREIRRPAAARHRRCVARQEQESGRDRPPLQENTQPDRRISELRRQEEWPSRLNLTLETVNESDEPPLHVTDRGNHSHHLTWVARPRGHMDQSSTEMV